MAGLNTATSAKAVVPSDSVEIRCDAIYVGGAGNISIVPMSDNTPVVFTAVPVGQTIYISARFIRATGTTATLMVALA